MSSNRITRLVATWLILVGIVLVILTVLNVWGLSQADGTLVGPLAITLGAVTLFIVRPKRK